MSYRPATGYRETRRKLLGTHHTHQAQAFTDRQQANDYTTGLYSLSSSCTQSSVSLPGEEKKKKLGYESTADSADEEQNSTCASGSGSFLNTPRTLCSFTTLCSYNRNKSHNIKMIHFLAHTNKLTEHISDTRVCSQHFASTDGNQSLKLQTINFLSQNYAPNGHPQ